MEDKTYIAPPLTEGQRDVLEKILTEYIGMAKKTRDYEKDPDLKRQYGMLIHEGNAVLAKLHGVQYTKPWSEFQKFFYPNSKLDNE